MALAMVGTALPALARAQEMPANPEGLLAGAAGAGATGVADFPPSSALRVYHPADFERFVPRNALDMVRRIPGFTVDTGGGGGGPGGSARGFGEASGNLLINGDRISSKSNSVEDELARIPASNVLRIEIVDGATLQIPGLSGQVANVIAETSTLAGQFTWRPQMTTGPAPIGWTEGNISLRGAALGVEYSIGLDSDGFIRGSEGPAIFTFANGTVDERFNTQAAHFRMPSLNGHFSFEPAPEVTVNITLSGGLKIFRYREEESRITGNPLPSFIERFRTWNNERNYELGGDIEFPVGPGDLKLIALESFERGNFRTQSLLDTDGLDPSGSRFERRSNTGERIGRAEYAWAMLGGDWQVSAEAAFNRLDNVARLFAYDAAEARYLEVPFPAGVGGVREERYESIISYGTQLATGLNLQVAAGAERSTISQTGINALSRSFRRPKGSLSLAWAAASGLDISLEIARRVGQLNFGDFLASVNLSDENQNSGNNQLRPEQSWETELEISRNFGAWGSATLALFDHRVEDFVTIVPTAGGQESRGNIDSARRYGLRFNGTLELEAAGWRGAQLDVRIEAEDSALIDPVTGEKRRYDRNAPFEIRLDFRHDLPDTAWAWGLELRDTQQALGYRLSEVAFDYNVPTFGAVWVENKDVFGLTVRGRLGNVFSGRNVLQRTIYAGPRNTAPVLFSEDRHLAIGLVFNLTVSGSF